jgi:hypothetical protein
VGGQQLATSSYRLDPTQEKYMCYQFYSPNEAVAITHVQSISQVGVHHLALFQAFGVKEPDAPHECPSLIKETWLPVFVSGSGSKELALPPNVGFVIAPKTQYILQLHLQNVTEEPIDVRAGIDLAYERNTSAVQAAGIWAAGRQQINIPPNTTDYQVHESCVAAQERHVFAVFPHMHKLGTKFDVTLTPKDGTASSFYQVDPWNFGNQPVEALDHDLQATDQIDVTCHWNNPGSAPVTYGESSDNEMCYFVTFYYPYQHLDGCID